MDINVNLLAAICEESGAPGFEDRVRDLVIKEVAPLVDEVQVDNLGNVVAIKRGKKGKKVMVAAHMDEIGFIITHIDNNGFLRFHTLGGFDPKTLTAQRVIVHGKKDMIGVMGSKPIHVMSVQEKEKPPQITDFFIDMGLSKKEVEKIVSVGDPVTRERKLIEMGECINCKSVDNRVSVFILIEALREMKEKPTYDIDAVFTVQEEVGIRGAKVAALEIQPDFGIGLDTTIAYDVPGAAEHEHVTKLGHGAAIKIMDGSTICDPRMVKYMKQTATKSKIKWQPEVLTVGGTDTSGIQQINPGGAIAGAISIPTRHIHQVVEMANKKDIRAAINLLKACLLGLSKFDWGR